MRKVQIGGILIFLQLLSFCINAEIRNNEQTAKNFHPLSDEMIDHINQLKPLWKAGRNFHPETNLESIKRMMGALDEPSIIKLPEKEYHNVQGLLIPKEFDSRTKWPNCPSIKEIRDQGSCGSCWAFAATEAMTDRLCIASKGTKQFRFSAENLVSCCGILSFCGFGCNGGFPSSAWRYWRNKGIVSGGPYGSNQGCQPYEIAPCEHHILGPRPNCTMQSTPKCHKLCEVSYNVTYKEDLHFGKDVYSIGRNVEQIQVEIMKNGPVEATLRVYEDFINYKSGIYHYVSGSLLGGHAIKLLGWGEDTNGVPYWIVANSWNYDWGDNGFFKILRGKNEVGIESGISAGIPK